MNTNTPIPSPHGEFHRGSIAEQAKEVRMHSISRGVYGLFVALVASYGYMVVDEGPAPMPSKPDSYPADSAYVNEGPAPMPAMQNVVTASPALEQVTHSVPYQPTRAEVEIAAGERSMLEDEFVPENLQHIDELRLEIKKLHDEGTN